MFLSLWLFVEFVFLEKKQVRLSDLKVTAFIIIAVSSAAVQTEEIFGYLHLSNWFIVFKTGRKEEKRKQSQSGDNEDAGTVTFTDDAAKSSDAGREKSCTGVVLRSFVSRWLTGDPGTIKASGSGSVGLES